MNSAGKGDDALAKSDWPSAIENFTRALLELPRAPTYYIKRSTAYSRLKPADGGPKYDAALEDANIALALARERGKRELILSAQMRRAVALYQLERYGDAAYIFGLVQDKISAGKPPASKENDVKEAMAQGGPGRSSKNSFEQELPIWVMKVNGKLKQLEEWDEKKAVTVKEYPEGVHIPPPEEIKRSLESAGAERSNNTADDKKAAGGKEKAETPAGADRTKETLLDPASGSSAPFTAGPAAPTPAASTPMAPSKVRHEWYQSNDSVVLTLYVKGVPKDKVDVEFKDHSISIEFPQPSGAQFTFSLDPLFAPIDTSASKYTVMSTKIEVVLRKSIPGQKWSALETTSTEKLADRSSIAPTAPSTAASKPSSDSTNAAPADQGPAYPTSSRHGVKNWDKLATDLTSKKKEKPKSKNEKSEAKADTGGDSDSESVDSEYGSGDPVDSFFKKLYAGADPDTRRAMVKSYYESQGTALSTNWSEVGKGRVEPKPPSD
ncbi:SGT1 and CS domain protein [Paecilomyces variotii No. 5]|uniref:SGT1 and CS domain protein n=1 Tax=Byssochlamys spectabilis (strain No. 5 / NBRC 109023) TaxID=1356009 RepID=V5FTR3_BYSSN|nr:SGT1 and CS domain protein [Paecilomyces variotii No. 5]